MRVLDVLANRVRVDIKDKNVGLTEAASPSCVNISISASCSRIRLLSLTCSDHQHHFIDPFYALRGPIESPLVTCSAFMEPIWPPLLPAITPRFRLLLLLYIPTLACVGYCDWVCWG